ncbi:GNAT family N-acetyltransferase [Streptomyces sp. NPDC005799]|uniref:GNAT family N-acetyltransferase n=1 Tax=Streptomyces sp. NPDC005799 TaxID=3154678 RepID=UPI0033F536AC
MDNSPVELGPIDAQHIEAVKDLWLELARHHWTCAPQITALAEPVDPEASWIMRCAQYRRWADEPGWLLLGATIADQLVGYAAARITASASSWEFGPTMGRLETLVVRDDARGHGLGQRLVAEVRRHWSAAGVRYGSVSVIAGNSGAERFYERLGAVEFTRTSHFPV